jgi:hypothetical protein
MKLFCQKNILYFVINTKKEVDISDFYFNFSWSILQNVVYYQDISMKEAKNYVSYFYFIFLKEYIM